MEATAREEEELLEEEQGQDKRISLWFWILPLLFLLTFVAVFASHRRASLSRVSPIASANTLPALGMVQFDLGKPTLTPDGQATLDRAADAMHGNPNVRLRLEGYDTPRPRPRKKDRRVIDPLTLQRALAVDTYLDARGIERSRVTGGKFAPHAAEQPAAFPNRNVDNRRAELYAQ